jgi:undecaprenol kinase
MSKIKRLIKSLRHAASGLKCALREQNFQIELLAAAIALIMAICFDISSWQIAILVLVILLVLIIEIINTIFERVVDILVPRQHPYAKAIKDMMAGAVLLACFGSVIVGIIIFVPYIKK